MILERLIHIAQDVLDGSEADLSAVTPEATLESLGLNSITMLMLMVGIEDEFAITFPSERIGEIKTVGDLVRIVEECQNA